MARKNYSRKRFNNSKKRYSKKFKKYSYIDRANYYENKASKGATRKEQDFAYGYLDGLRGVKVHPDSSEHEKNGNNAGLRFWNRMTRTKI